MKRVLFVRHAKSSWADPSLPDHDRPLNGRGKRDAPQMGRWLAAQALLPDLIVSSTARRARKTAEKLAEAAGYTGLIEWNDALYHASSEQHAAVLAGLPESCRQPMLIGHNPGMETFLAGILSKPVQLPTAAVAWVGLECSAWANFGLTTPGRLLALWTPKDLPDFDL